MLVWRASPIPACRSMRPSGLMSLHSPPCTNTLLLEGADVLQRP